MAMEYVLTSAEMKDADRAAINDYGIESLVLMERAALQAVRVVEEKIWLGHICGGHGWKRQ